MYYSLHHFNFRKIIKLFKSMPLARYVVVFSLVFLITPFLSGQENATGVVFHDVNRNGIRDHGEPGIKDISVSNQREVVRTDADGRYVLPIEENTILFITKPPHYNVPLNENNVPQFYYIHQPQGSPAGLQYAGIAPTGTLPESVDFPLIKTARKYRFNAIITGDPQPRNRQEVNYYRDDVVTDMKSQKAEFYLALGDVAYDDLAVYAPLNRAVAQLGIPAYNVPGNHDMNYRGAHDRFATETFKRNFGPGTFSFEYGKVHFIVFDDVEYNGWDTANNKKGSYRGFLTEKQLTWLNNDLAFVPEDVLIVLTMHIPIASETNSDPPHSIANRQELFEILKDRTHLLALAGHYHLIEHVTFTTEMGWLGKAPFPSIIAGAGCGAWWSGPPDSRGIPESLCLDGSPNGYFVFSFDGARFQQRFYPVAGDKKNQMRISRPAGILSRDSLATQQIVVNVFNGNRQSTVEYMLDHGAPVMMQRTIMKDPFMVDYLAQYRDFIPGWIQDVAPVSHIWTAPLPENLSTGTHSLHVFAKDSFGNLYEGFRLFEIAEQKETKK
ncbi:MAG: calcineurin-like phosphoesterase C-terminal domain-containing protein [bacterium]